MNFSLTELGLLDAKSESRYDNLTELAARFLDAPVSLISVVDFVGERQFFKSQLGLMDPWATERQTPLSHSFCQHVVRNDEALVVNNAPDHPLVRNNLAIADLGVIAYLGVPVYAPDQKPIGALCVIGSEPRAWTGDEIDTMRKLAMCVTDAIRLTAELRHSEQLRQEQRDFTYGISHDLKSPANTLGMVLDEIGAERDVLSPGARELLDGGVATVDRMRRQIDEVLSYIRTIGREPEREDVDLSEIVTEILADLACDIQQCGAEVVVSDLPSVTGDRAQLRALFQNLICNALKFRRPDRSPVVGIDATELDHKHSIHVQDNGIGIDPRHQGDVFDMFARLHSASDYPGSGVGLALCRRVAENHNGCVSIWSKPGEGSVFSVSLPKVPG